MTPSLISSDLWIGNFISIFTCSNGQFGLSGFGHINQRPAEKPRSRGSYAPALTPRIRSVFVRRTNRLLLSPDEFLFWHPSIFSIKPSVRWVCQSFCYWYFLISAIFSSRNTFVFKVNQHVVRNLLIYKKKVICCSLNRSYQGCLIIKCWPLCQDFMSVLSPTIICMVLICRVDLLGQACMQYNRPYYYKGSTTDHTWYLSFLVCC